jgi:hypothetical protein
MNDKKNRDPKSGLDLTNEQTAEPNATSPEELSDADLEQVSGGGDGDTSPTWRPS